MCRWLAYVGSPVSLEDLLYGPENSLIAQSLHSRLGHPTNGDGFGVGWYGAKETPGVFHSTEPAWNDRNLRELASQAVSGHVLAHVRAATGTPVQQTNCHPFRHGKRLWMHNGSIAHFSELKRDLVMAVDPSLYPQIEGSTDSETLFFLALTFGLEDDAPAAVATAVAFVEKIGANHGVLNPMHLTVATTDGETLHAFRYSTEHKSSSLFRNADVATLRARYPDDSQLAKVSDTSRLVVSEPLGDLQGAWLEVPESTCVVIADGQEELMPFEPSAALAK